MEPCTKCTKAELNPVTRPIIRKYPCKIRVDENEIAPCREISYAELKKISDEKKTQNKKREPCKEVKTPLRKLFKEFMNGNMCKLPHLRNWDKNECDCRSLDKPLPKWVRRRPRVRKCLDCPRELEEYERNLWIPICKPPIKPVAEVIPEPIDATVCVFCLGSLYTGGYLHDLYQKMPYIKKQSEEYGDDINWRIGIRSRITVHKICYKKYIDRHKPEKGTEENDEADSDMWCDKPKEESDEEFADLINVKKPNFCIRTPKPPELPPGKSSRLTKVNGNSC